MKINSTCRFSQRMVGGGSILWELAKGTKPDVKLTFALVIADKLGISQNGPIRV